MKSFERRMNIAEHILRQDTDLFMSKVVSKIYVPENFRRDPWLYDGCWAGTWAYFNYTSPEYGKLRVGLLALLFYNLYQMLDDRRVLLASKGYEPFSVNPFHASVGPAGPFRKSNMPNAIADYARSNAILTPSDRLYAISQRKADRTNADIGKELGVSPQCISRTNRGYLGGACYEYPEPTPIINFWER